MKFDIKTDNELIAAGTHFWCSGHLAAVPIGERSTKDSRYCVSCQKIIEGGYREIGQLKKYLAGIPAPAAASRTEAPKMPLEQPTAVLKGALVSQDKENGQENFVPSWTG